MKYIKTADPENLNTIGLVELTLKNVVTWFSVANIMHLSEYVVLHVLFQLFKVFHIFIVEILPATLNHMSHFLILLFTVIISWSIGQHST